MRLWRVLYFDLWFLPGSTITVTGSSKTFTNITVNIRRAYTLFYTLLQTFHNIIA